MQSSMYNIIFNSTSSRNSLVNLMSLSKKSDWFAKELIENTFASNEKVLELFSNTDINNSNTQQAKVLDMRRIAKKEKIKKYNL